jgi:GT2 family glycosyltransferase
MKSIEVDDMFRASAASRRDALRLEPISNRVAWLRADAPDRFRVGTFMLSVIILNYNGQLWLRRCLQSVKAQTVISEVEVIVADNDSPDDSGTLAKELLADWPNGQFVSLGHNYGFCGGNNRAAQRASGKYILFLNPDTWLEPDCLEKLLADVQQTGAGGGGPLVLEYGSDDVQDNGASGFDIFGIPVAPSSSNVGGPVLSCSGCALLVQQQLFWKIGAFDEEFFMYGEEQDLFWRIWMAGRSVRLTTAARLHHRGEANSNPAGGEGIVELRCSVSVRYLANRNALATLFKNSEHFLMLLAIPNTLLLAVEALAWLAIGRQAGFVREAYWNALRDVWRMRDHIRAERRRLRSLRQRSDWWFLRFLRLKPGRLHLFRRIFRFGLPRIAKDSFPTIWESTHPTKSELGLQNRCALTVPQTHEHPD